MIDEEGLFEDRRLFDVGKNAFSLECERIIAAAIKKSMTDDDIKNLDLDIHMEIQERVEIMELCYQLNEEVLLVLLSRKLDIPSDIADYIGSAFDDGIVPLMSDYTG